MLLDDEYNTKQQDLLKTSETFPSHFSKSSSSSLPNNNLNPDKTYDTLTNNRNNNNYNSEIDLYEELIDEREKLPPPIINPEKDPYSGLNLFNNLLDSNYAYATYYNDNNNQNQFNNTTLVNKLGSVSGNNRYNNHNNQNNHNHQIRADDSNFQKLNLKRVDGKEEDLENVAFIEVNNGDCENNIEQNFLM